MKNILIYSRVTMLKARYTEDEIIEAGVDEVGRGCLWGPLVTAAVVWLPEEHWTPEIRAVAEQVKDSKKLTEKRRDTLSAQIRDCALAVGIGRVEAAEIDQLGMTRSNQLAFSRAVTDLAVEPERLLIDGIVPLPHDLWSSHQGEQHCIVEGDAKYIPIAAASIVAKVYRDTWVKQWCIAHPEIGARYGLEGSKGYGTATHRAALADHGPHMLHRRLFLRKILGDQIYTAPVREVNTQCQIQDDPDIE